MRLEDATYYLGWPNTDEVTRPTGGGAKHYAQMVEQKIGKVLQRKFELRAVTTGILSANAMADTAEASLAIVVQFSMMVADDVLRETQRLCWNFSRAALLVTLEPARIQAWTCALAPKSTRTLHDLRVIPPITPAEDQATASLLQTEAAQALHWINLVSGAFLQQHPSKFRKDERAGSLLVANLRAVRKSLLKQKLPPDICHTLLARLIFTQFLFQRKDSEGRPAISQKILDNRFDEYLGSVYSHADALRQILQDKDEAYALFRWLNEKFNGDLFPGKGATAQERETEWREEKDKVAPEHLRLLSAFVAGDIEIGTGQRSLWPLYSFDTLPLEFISSVYEEFLNEDQHELSAYYTPPHLVDFVLDGVLSWGGNEWDLRILDPCCGSGIFLVKTFQRLVQRWKNANPGREPRVDDLRGLLENNLFGVDDSEEAVRVASFSLCLALCDAIDPKHYWKRTILPPLRNVRLVKSDFFAEDREEFATPEDDALRRWDLVIGNAPWRDSALTEDSLGTRWAAEHGWPIVDGNAGPLFLAKGAALTKPSGRVAMIQPAATLLYQRRSDASHQLRKRLFASCRVEEVVSFAHLRFILFESANSPACLVTLQPTAPEAEYYFNYVCPKPLRTSEDKALIAIEPQDMHEVSATEAVHDPLLLIVLLYGQRRDRLLIERLSQAKTLRKLKAKSREDAAEEKVLLTREGIIRGRSDQRDEPQIVGRRILESPNFPEPGSMTLDADKLQVNRDAKVDRRASSDFSAFELPQLLIKQSLLKAVGRFQAQLVRAEQVQRGVICTQSYVSVHQFDGKDDWLRAACLTFRSSVSAYYLALTSRLAFDRAEALSDHILDVPLPPPADFVLTDDIPPNQIDDLVETAFRLQEPERALISDLLEFGYRDGATRSGSRPSRAATIRSDDEDQDDLLRYADFFLKTLRATFGKERAVRATVYEENKGHSLLPVRMVAIHLDWPQRRHLLTKESMKPNQLRSELARFYAEQLTVRTRDGAPITSGLGFRRVARIFITHEADVGVTIPTVLFVKPDQRRYWTRSQGLRDADELAAAIFTNRQRWIAAK